MKHEGLFGTPEELFGAPAKRQCLQVCQDFIDEIETNPNTPFLTGKMKFGFERSDEGDGAKVTNTDAPYWIHVNYGHDVVDEKGGVVGHVAQQPFATNAWEIVRAGLG